MQLRAVSYVSALGIYSSLSHELVKCEKEIFTLFPLQKHSLSKYTSFKHKHTVNVKNLTNHPALSFHNNLWLYSPSKKYFVANMLLFSVVTKCQICYFVVLPLFFSPSSLSPLWNHCKMNSIQYQMLSNWPHLVSRPLEPTIVLLRKL